MSFFINLNVYIDHIECDKIHNACFCPITDQWWSEDGDNSKSF